MFFTDWYGRRLCHGSFRRAALAAVAVSALFWAGGAVADGAVSGVRGASLELYENIDGGAPVLTLSRAEGRDLKSKPAPILDVQGDWLQIQYGDGKYWVKADQARETGDRPTLTCTASIGGSTAGATRGIGEGCRK